MSKDKSKKGMKCLAKWFIHRDSKPHVNLIQRPLTLSKENGKESEKRGNEKE
jgi:hypothetical protein